MSGGKRFRYQLEPLRLTREWALDAARLALTRQNTELAEAEQASAEARQRLAQAQEQARALVATGQALPVQSLQQHGRYLGWLDGAARQTEQQRLLQQQERDALAGQLATAQRALDGLERHRKQMRQAFRRTLAQDEARQTDELWAVLQAGRNGHDH